MISSYLSIEDPQALETAIYRSFVARRLQGVNLLVGIDRVDQAPNDLRPITRPGRLLPKGRFQEEALFQMRFYASLLSLTKRLPKVHSLSCFSEGADL